MKTCQKVYFGIAFIIRLKCCRRDGHIQFNRFYINFVLAHITHRAIFATTCSPNFSIWKNARYANCVGIRCDLIFSILFCEIFLPCQITFGHRQQIVKLQIAQYTYNINSRFTHSLSTCVCVMWHFLLRCNRFVCIDSHEMLPSPNTSSTIHADDSSTQHAARAHVEVRCTMHPVVQSCVYRINIFDARRYFVASWFALSK